MAGTKVLRNTSPLWYTVIMAKIPLFGKRGTGYYAEVDDDDVQYVAGTRWHLSDTGYAVNRSGNKTTRMHRVINKTPEGLFTDHKNNNRLDNRKSNLRTVTQKENCNNRSGDKGYAWDKSKNKWIVRYKSTFYGRYSTEDEAKKAYQLACSGVPYVKQRRKLWHLPTGISKQFGKYRVRPQRNGKRIWLGQFATLEEAQTKLTEWQERG